VQMIKAIFLVSTIAALLATVLFFLALLATEMSGQVKPRHAVIRVPGEGE
jgi:hypothetical protein